MVIHYTNIYHNVVFPGKKACIFRFKVRKSCANGDSVTLEFMIGAFGADILCLTYWGQVDWGKLANWPHILAHQ